MGGYITRAWAGSMLRGKVQIAFGFLSLLWGNGFGLLLPSSHICIKPAKICGFISISNPRKCFIFIIPMVLGTAHNFPQVKITSVKKEIGLLSI